MFQVSPIIVRLAFVLVRMNIGTFISCGGRAIEDLLHLISLEGSGRKSTAIKGISPATFLDGTHDQVTVLLRTDGV